jgi:hypothetical protein
MKDKELGAAEAIIQKIQTTVDGGLRVTIDMSADNFELVKKLLELKANGDNQVYVGFARN